METAWLAGGLSFCHRFNHRDGLERAFEQALGVVHLVQAGAVGCVGGWGGPRELQSPAKGLWRGGRGRAWIAVLAVWPRRRRFARGVPYVMLDELLRRAAEVR